MFIAFILFFSFYSCGLISSDYMPRYEDVFSSDIYEQGSFFQSDNVLPSDQDLIDLLYNNKRKSIEELFRVTLLKVIESNKDLCEEEKKRLKDQNFWNDIRSLAASGLNTIPYAGNFLADVTRKNNFNTPIHNIGALIKETKDLEYRKNSLLEGITSEPIKREEEKYVVNKRFISDDFQYVIEDALIQSRKRGMPIYNIKDFISEALTLPTGFKKICLNRSSSGVVLESLLNRFEKDRFFSNFSPEVKLCLEKLMVDSYYSSLNDGQGEIPLKNFYYFWGNPGVGKSDASRRIVEFLSLPYFETYVKDISDFFQDNMEGTTWYRMDSKKGWLVSPMMSKDSEGNTYSNSFLIINDFDRILLSSGPRADSALGFLLNYLDPIKKTFYSPYFKSHIDISRMSIIITGNQPIPDENRFSALKSRLTIQQFPDPSDDLSNSVLKSYFLELSRHYYISLDENEKESLIKEVLETANSSIRDMKSELKNKVLEKKLPLIKKGSLKIKNLTASNNNNNEPE